MSVGKLEATWSRCAKGKSAELRSKNAELRTASDQLVALLNQKTEGLKAENLKLKALIQPRDISPTEETAIAKTLEPFGGKFVLILIYIDPEAARLGSILKRVLTGGGEGTHQGSGPLNVMSYPLVEGVTMPPRTGIEIKGDDEQFVKALSDALFSIGHLEPASNLGKPIIFGGGFVMPPQPPRTPDATIYVGLKPIRFLRTNGSSK